MKVLVVDDDRTTRFLLRRTLITEFGCAVTEAGDGIDALEALAKSRYQLMILDVQMPVMDGLETMRALRDTPEFKSLPVVMLTAERNETIVQQIIALGVLDYMTKPLVPDRIVERLRRIIGWLHSEADTPVDRTDAEARQGLEESASLLIVDGNEDFRRFFVETLGPTRTVVQAETGARGFRACLESNPGAVFIGSSLGVLNEGLLVRKIRSTPAVRETYLIAIVDKEEDAAARLAGYDGKITRTFVPETFLKQFEGLGTSVSGSIQELLTLHPGLRVTLISAAEQVFGMMLSTEVALRDVTPIQPGERVMVAVRGAWGNDSAVELRGGCDLSTGRRMAGNLLGIDPSMVDDEDVDAAVSEVFNMITSRVRNTLVGKEIPMEFGEPAVARSSSGLEQVAEGSIALCFQSAARDVEFWLVLLGDTHARATGEAVAAAPAPAA